MTERKRQSVHSQRVLISSTSLDLHDHRLRLRDALLQMNQIPIGMEDFGAAPADAMTVSYSELASAEIVVLIVAWRYGFVPEGEARSITELEYEEAKRRGLPVYVYLADPATEADEGPNALFPAETRQPEYVAQVAAFRARLSDSNANVYDTFNSPADLSARVLAALGRELARHKQTGRHALIEAQALDRRTFKLGDDDAATFEYLPAPLQDVWNTTTRALSDASEGVGGKRGVIVLGEANVGKTRLALEALIQTMPDWPVLRWSEAFTSADLPPAGSLPDDRLVLFIDDLQNYAAFAKPEGLAVALTPGPAATLRALVESISSRSLVIVATCRVEDEGRTRAELGWLFTKLAPVRVPQFSADAEDVETQRILAGFAAHGATHVEDWDGTLGSLVLGLSKKREQYDSLVVRCDPASALLRAMKLLTEAWVFAHTERRLRTVCAEIFHQQAIAQDEHVWESAYKELVRLQFVRVIDSTDGDDGSSSVELALAIRKDTYLDGARIITDYPDPYDPGELFRHLQKLEVVFNSMSDTLGLYSLGGSYYVRGEYASALTLYEKALALRPDNSNIWLVKGLALDELGRNEEALEAYDHALALHPGGPLEGMMWNTKGIMLAQRGRWEEALAAYDRALALDDVNPITWQNRAHALSRLERWADALASYKRALESLPSALSAPVWNGMGIALGQLARFEEALTAIQDAIALDAQDPHFWGSKGVVLYRMKRYEEALAAYTRAIELWPDYFDAWIARGNTLLELQRWDEARAAYERATALRPEHAVAWYKMGFALAQLHRPTEALAACEQAVVLQPDLADAWIALGVIQGGRQKWNQALESCDRALKLQPESALAHQLRGEALQALDRGSERNALADDGG